MLSVRVNACSDINCRFDAITTLSLSAPTHTCCSYTENEISVYDLVPGSYHKRDNQTHTERKVNLANLGPY